MANSKLEEGIALIREAFAELEDNLKTDLIARITGESKEKSKIPAENQPRKRSKGQRAPRGAAKAFVAKMLREHPKSRFQNFLDNRITAAEKSISESTIRKELLRGRGKGDYIGERGVYSLAK